MHRTKTLFISFFLLLFTLCAWSQDWYDDNLSLINNDLSLFSDDNQLYDSTDSLVLDENSLIDPEQSLLDKNKNLIDESDYGIYTISFENIIESSEDEIIKNLYEQSVEDKYIGHYGKWLDSISENPEARQHFVRYFSDWQQLGFKEDFFSYSKNRAATEKQIEYCYDKAIVKFGAGTAIVATTWIFALAIPGGQLVTVPLLIIAKATTYGSISGAAIGGIMSAGMALVQGKHGEEFVYVTINGAADGFLIGAITGVIKETFSTLKIFSDAICVENKIYTTSGLVYNKNGNVIGKIIRFAGTNQVDDIYYVGKNTASVFDKSGKEVAKIAKYRDNYVLYNESGRIVGYLKDGNLISYCDPSSAAIIKEQYRATPGTNTTEEVKKLAKLNGQFNPETGNFLDAIDGSEIIGTPEMGHINGHEYTNELQRAFMNGEPEAVFREKMRDPSIYQLESVIGNRSHVREAANLTIDNFRNVNKNIGDELWKVLLTQ